MARERAKDVGLVTQDWVGYAGDVAKNAGIGAVIAAAGGALFVLGLRRLGERWWIAGAVIVVAYGAATTYASPVVLDPLFNDFRKLPAGELRSDVLRLAREAGVDAGEVYEVDASRRTTAANAYVAGVGRTKRVVIYDNLIRGLHAGRDAACRRARARPRPLPRPAQRADLGGDRRPCRACGRWPS